MRMLAAIPALPVTDIVRSVAFYRDALGFAPVHQEDGFAVLVRDEVEIHLWGATDERWRARAATPPIVTGAESFIAGTASCRVRASDVDAFHATIHPLGILHPNAPLTDQPWGTREFGALDPDGNLVTFFGRP